MNAKLIFKSIVAKDTIELTFTTNQVLDFSAGQFINIGVYELQNDPRGCNRLFSLVNPPTENRIIKILFRSGKSPYKTALQKLELGDTVTYGFPQGDFSFPINTAPHSTRSANQLISSTSPQLTRLTGLTHPAPLVYLAAGVGIAPFMSLGFENATLFYSNKSKQTAPYLDRLPIESHLIFTQNENHLDLTKIKKLFPEWKDKLYLISGPPNFVESLEEQLLNAGVTKTNLKRESFDGY